jgi:hypothetical protein
LGHLWIVFWATFTPFDRAQAGQSVNSRLRSAACFALDQLLSVQRIDGRLNASARKSGFQRQFSATRGRLEQGLRFGLGREFEEDMQLRLAEAIR